MSVIRVKGGKDVILKRSRMTPQLDFFDVITKDDVPPNTIGTVEKLSNGYFQAIIQGGWWVGHGKSKKLAINSAVKKYEDEREKYA